MQFKFCDRVENGWASERNPHRIGYFVRSGYRRGKLNPGPWIELTDKEGAFWELSVGKDHRLTNHGQQKER